MADNNVQYEYGRTPEETAPGILGFFNLLRGPLVDAFTPMRRPVISAPTEKVEDITDPDSASLRRRYRTTQVPGIYGPPERGIEYMPVVQGSKSAYEFLRELISSGKKRGETAEALVKGIGTLLENQYRAGVQAGLTGDLRFYDPEQKRVVSYDPLLTPATMGAAGLLAPVKGPGAVLGMFAGRNAATADPKKFARAEEMAEKGRSREDIWKETGLFRWERNGEPVSDWKFEVPGSPTVAFNPTYQTPTGRLRVRKNPVVSDIYSYPELFEAYPGLSKTAAKAPAKDFTASWASPLLEELEKKRTVILAKLQALKASDKNPESPEYAAEYRRLQEEDAEILQQYLALAKGGPPAEKPVSVLSGLELDIDGNLIFKTEDQRMARPLSEIPLRKMDAYEKRRMGGYYADTRDYIATGSLPGQPLSKSFKKIPWDEQGRYVQRFSHEEYHSAVNKAQEDFEKAGISLDVKGYRPFWDPDDWTSKLSSAPSLEYRLRRWGGKEGPENAIDPETLPDYLKKQWDELQADGKFVYKKDYEPSALFRSTMSHELQHAIQSRTPGDETGENPLNLKGVKIADPAFAPPWKMGQPKMLTPREIYMRKLGEMEARLSQARMDMTAKERKEKFPWTQEGGLDRRESDLILGEDIRAAGGVEYD